MHSPEELIARAQKALTHAVIRIVERTQSPNAADTAVKAAEYPNSICTAARYLATLRETDVDEYRKLIAPILYDQEIVHSDFSDARIFTCSWSTLGNEGGYENEGTLHVFSQKDLPPLFWDYQMHNTAGDILSSTIYRHAQQAWMQDRQGIITEGSQSIPTGLQFRIWPRKGSSTLCTIEFAWVNQFRKIVWTRRIGGGKDDLYIREASRNDLPRFVPREQIFLTHKQQMGNSKLVFSREISAAGWQGQGFSCNMCMEYRFLLSTTHATETTTRETHSILEGSGGEAAGHIVMVARKDSLAHPEQGGNAFPLVRDIGEMLFSPEKINVKQTLLNCFSFKFQELEALKCLA